jgi:hypothetical protein
MHHWLSNYQTGRMSPLTAILFFGVLLGVVVMMATPMDRTTKHFFWLALALKISAGLLFGVVYSFYYHISDSHVYFSDAVSIAELASRDFFGYLNFLYDGEGHHLNQVLTFKTPRAVFLSKLCSLLVLTIGKNYWLLTLSISVLTFLFTWYFFQELSKRFSVYRGAFFVALFVFPSGVFWSSGISKESFAMAGLFFLSALILKLYHGVTLRWPEAVAGLFFIWLVWSLKYYYLAVWLPIAVAVVLVHRVFKPKAELIVFFILLLFLLFATGLLHPNFIWKHFVDVIVTNYQQLVLSSDPGDAIQYYKLGESTNRLVSLFYITINAPWALFSAWVRPFLWEVNSAMQLVASIENLVLFLVVVGCWQNYRLLFQPHPYRLLAVGVFVYSILLLIFLGLSTPNFGTLSRYRIGCLPFLLILLLRHNKWSQHLLRKIDWK